MTQLLVSMGISGELLEGSPPVFAATDPVLLSGSGRAGTEYTLVLNYQDPQPDPEPELDVVWLRDGVAQLIPNAQSIIPDDTYLLRVSVTASNPRGSAGPELSQEIGLLPGYASDPVITASAFQVGTPLTLSTPTVIGQVSTVSHRFRRLSDGAIVGLSSSYTPTDHGEYRGEVLFTGVYGTTVAESEVVSVLWPAPTVEITDITDSGYTGITQMSVTFTTTGQVTDTLIEWFSVADPTTVLATGTPVVFDEEVLDLKCQVKVTNPSGISATAVSNEVAVVEQATAPVVGSATIDQGGQTVPVGTTLLAILTGVTGSPPPSAPVIQWRSSGVNISGATGGIYTIAAGVTGPIDYTYVVSNGVAPSATGASSDSVAVASATSPTLSGIPNFETESADADFTYSLAQHATNVSGAVWDLVPDEIATPLTINFQTGDWDFIDYTGYFVNCSNFIATGVSQVSSPFGGSASALPAGIANSEVVGVLRTANNIANGSYSVRLWGTDGVSVFQIAATLVGAAPGSPTIPPAPPELYWRLDNVGDGSLAIVVLSPFPNGGSPNTNREYEINDSGTWVSFGVTGSGTFVIPAASLTLGQPATVRLRSTNALTAGVWNESLPKTTTPTITTGSGTLDIVDDFPVSVGSMVRPLDIVDDFPVSGA